MADYAISNVPRRVVYAASGTGPYAFTFEVLSANDIAVYKGDTLLTLTTDYTVTINANGTGSVTLVSTAGTSNITIVGSKTIARTTDFTTGGDFFANTLNDELDAQTIFIQQVAETAERGLKAPVTDPTDINMTLPRKADRANKYLAFDSLGNPKPGDTAVEVAAIAAIAPEIVIVAGIDTEVVAVASNATNINTVAGNNSNITTVAGISAAVSTVAANITDIQNAEENADAAAASAILANDWATKTSGAVAGGEYSAKYHAQLAATAKTNAETAETNAETAQAAAESARDATLAAFDSFDDRYLGSKTADPTLDNDGNALVAGALYFNSVLGEMKVYTGSAWVSAYVSGTGFLAASNNLSDVANAGTARTNLGLAIGINVQAYDADLTTLGAGGSSARSFLGLAIGTDVQAYDANLTSAANRGLFKKTDSTIVAFTKTGAGTATTSSIIYVDVNGSIKTIASGTSIAMPTLVAGTDYAIWAKTDGSLEATSNHTSPPTANARKIGGFHYAPGGNATGTSGGNTTAQINEYSFWDLKWRPACNDPRGMTLVAGGFWVDIYLANTDCDTNGTSKYNVIMADGSSPPKVPTLFGGNGSTTYGSLTWFESCELASAYGKRLLTQREFMAMAYGTTEASSIGSDQGSTILNAAYTSKWGVMQSTGVLWVWGDDRAGPFAGASWNANTEGRGSEFNAPNAVILGGVWFDGSISGSRCSIWNNSASLSFNGIGVRCACDHLLLD